MKTECINNMRLFLGLLILSFVVTSEAARFSLRFSDRNDKIVGGGSITVNLGEVMCVETSYNGMCGDEESEDVIYVKNPVTDFSAGFENIFWEFDGSKTWWAAPGQTPGQQSITRYGIYIRDNYWFFGDGFDNERSFTMDFRFISELKGYGTWSQSYYYNGERITEDGTWKATSFDLVVPKTSSSWVSGTAASLQSPTSLTMDVAGWGALLTVPSSVSGTGGWLETPLPTPTMVSGVNTDLTKVSVKYEGTAMIDQVYVNDGMARLISRKVAWTGAGTGTITLLIKPTLIRAVNVSLHVKNNCTTSICPVQTMNVISVGGIYQ